MGTDVIGELTRELLDRIRDVCPPDVDPATAAIALIAMIERASYYVLSGGVAGVDSATMVDTLARTTHAALCGVGTPATR